MARTPPSLAHLPMDCYYTPDEFREFKRIALELGFGHVESGPLVRSSYHAHEQTASFEAGSPVHGSQLAVRVDSLTFTVTRTVDCDLVTIRALRCARQAVSVGRYAISEHRR